MKKLLKAYGFNSDMQYYERIVMLFKTESIEAGKLMFMDMPLKYKAGMLKSICIGVWNAGLSNQSLSKLFDCLAPTK